MTRFDDDFDHDLGVIAERITPSPTAWEEIQQRIADREPHEETEIIMLTDNTTTTRRWPLVAAAAAVAALAITGIALVNRNDGAEAPATPPPPAPTVAPDGAAEPTTDQATEEQAADEQLTGEPIDGASDPALPSVGEQVEPGRYATDAIGTPVTLDVQDGQTGPWTLVSNDQTGIQLISDDTGREFMAIGRVGSWFDAVESRTEGTRGLGSIPADGLDTWIAVNDVIVVDSAEVQVGGRDASYRLIRLDPTPGATADFCPPGEAPCLWAASGSADLVEADSTPVPFGRDRVQALWSIDMGEFEPVFIFAAANLDDDGPWFTDVVQPIVDSITFGDPAPVIPGGTARIPERVAVTAEMTVNQTGTRDVNNPWPVEWTGSLDGDITGTYEGTGVASPNEAEVTLDWTMDVTIEGLGTGTLTLQSDWIWNGDGARFATDHVIGGTGDLEGMTGFGRTQQTNDDGGGGAFGGTATMELMLALPSN